MGWPVAWLKQLISANEFDMWCRFYRRYPFDPESLHQMPAALVAATLLNCHAGPKGRQLQASDLALFRPAEKPANLDESWSRVRARLQANPASKPA